jgi:hypothetical protein
LSTAIISASIAILILLASATYGSDARTLSLDIIGSRVNNTTIISPGSDRVDVEIVGSTTANLAIGSPEDAEVHGSVPCDPDDGYITPWDDFKRPLCYPWTSYIPTRYNRPFSAPHLERSITGKAVMVLGSWTGNH